MDIEGRSSCGRGPRRLLALVVLAATLLYGGAAPAQVPDAEASRLKAFAASVGRLLYFMAWPTAAYDDVRFNGFYRRPDGVDLRLTLSGTSALDGSALWTELVLEIRRGMVSEIRWGRNNAILFQPGETMKNSLPARAKLSREYARENPLRAAGAPVAAPAASFAIVCIGNPTDRPVAYRLDWGRGDDTRTLQPNEAHTYWSADRNAPFVISFDNSHDEGYTPSRISLPAALRDRVPTGCADGEVYNFQSSRQAIGLRPAQGKTGAAYPFLPNLVATAK